MRLGWVQILALVRLLAISQVSGTRLVGCEHPARFPNWNKSYEKNLVSLRDNGRSSRHEWLRKSSNARHEHCAGARE